MQFNSKKILGVIPARGGSKGIPRKNIKDFLGKPLIGWSVLEAVESKVFDRIIALTDDVEIAEAAKKYGAEVPFLEPAEFAVETSHVFWGLKWLLNHLYETEGYWPDYVMLMEPTAPGRSHKHIVELVKMVAQSSADSGFTVWEVPSGNNAHWQFSIDSAGQASIVTGEPIKDIVRRRQLLPKLYVRGGSTYICKTEFLLKETPDMYGDDTRALVIDRKYGVDLDSEEDWVEAEKIVSSLKNEYRN